MSSWQISAEPLAGLGPATIVRADARCLPLADDSVDLIVTSPPYFALRSYQDGGEPYAGQIGSELTPAEFVDVLLEVTRECMRVLKPSGSIFVNLGDKYSSGSSGDRNTGFNMRWGNAPGRLKQERSQVRSERLPGMQPKSLIGVPWRYAIRCIDELGLILRAEVIWSKPNGLPESVTDRVRRSHEQWFHFTLESRYFAAVDEIREPTPRVERRPKGVRAGVLEGSHGTTGHDGNGMRMSEEWNNPLGKLPGSVREVPSAPLKVPAALGIDHFAAFPPAWPAWLIRGWSPSGVCVECGEGRRPTTVAEFDTQGRTTNGPRFLARRYESPARDVRAVRSTTITGYACACPDTSAAVTPGVVLDPFGGTGTTAMAARSLGRHGISVDRSADYCRLAQWRVTEPDELAAARGLPREKRGDAQLTGQVSIFDHLDDESEEAS